MKQKLSFVMMVVLIIGVLCSCSTQTQTQNEKAVQPQPYVAIKEIDPCVVEPDDNAHMSDKDRQHYRNLMNALLMQQKTVQLSESKEKNEYYIDLLKQSPYYFFAKSCALHGNTAVFEFEYTISEQEQMRDFMDENLLRIANDDIKETDNELDIILKIHRAVANEMMYDHDRTDNKQIGSPLFNYPVNEIYKSLKTQKSLCYGFAYTLRFALLQHGIDCFCVYGPCSYRDEAHMWNIFKYNGKFYTCDPAWDRSENEYARLYHFGKTDAERFSDGLEEREYSSKFFEEYGEVSCTDETFKFFRGINRYAYIDDHEYYMENYEGENMHFDSQTLKFD